MLRIGVSSITFPLTPDSLAMLAREGISDVEISLTHRECESVSILKLSSMAKEAGINICSYHLPFAGPDVLDVSSDVGDIRKRTVALWCKLIRRGADVGIRRYIAHPSSEPITTDMSGRARRLSIARDTLASLAEVAALSGAEIAVENLPRTCLGSTVAEMEYLVSGSDKLAVCLDTNHFLADTNEQLIECLGHRIRALHISDYDRINERHWLPGEGSVNWHGLYRRLIESGFDGVWLYELLPHPKTIIRDRDITPRDIAENAKAIFNGVTPSTFSHRIPGLGMWP